MALLCWWLVVGGCGTRYVHTCLGCVCGSPRPPCAPSLPAWAAFAAQAPCGQLRAPPGAGRQPLCTDFLRTPLMMLTFCLAFWSSPLWRWLWPCLWPSAVSMLRPCRSSGGPIPACHSCLLRWPLHTSPLFPPPSAFKAFEALVFSGLKPHGWMIRYTALCCPLVSWRRRVCACGRSVGMGLRAGARRHGGVPPTRTRTRVSHCFAAQVVGVLAGAWHDMA